MNKHLKKALKLCIDHSGDEDLIRFFSTLNDINFFDDIYNLIKLQALVDVKHYLYGSKNENSNQIIDDGKKSIEKLRKTLRHDDDPIYRIMP